METIHRKNNKLHIYVRQDKYKGELKSHNWVGRTYINGKQKVSSSGTANLEEAIPILEKWFDELQTEKPTNDKILKCIDDIYVILLDGISISGLEWVFESHSYTSRKGFFTVIDISYLKSGKHNLIVHSNSKYSLKDEFNTESGLIGASKTVRFKEEIPFYYYPE